jgi:hypothetical protein
MTQTLRLITSRPEPRRKQHHLLLYHCCGRVCCGSHAIATQAVHWRAGSCLATAVFLFSFRGCCLETSVVSEPFASNGFFSGSAVFAFSQYAALLFSVGCLASTKSIEVSN